MTTRLNPDTGLFEDVPSNPTHNPSNPTSAFTLDAPHNPEVKSVDPSTLPENNKSAPLAPSNMPPTSTPSNPLDKPNTAVTLVNMRGLTVKQRLYLEIKEILDKHEGLESNIPVNSPYWDKLNEYRGIR
jgi:hypothetical protein